MYFDLAFEKDPKETGYYWGGFADDQRAYEFTPDNIFMSARRDRMGNVLNQSSFSDKVTLTPEGESNVIGIQGQLWGENLKGQKVLEYMAMPRLIALAERAWTPKPTFASVEAQNERFAAMDQAYLDFAATLGYRELPRLDYLNEGYGYRIPLAGAVIDNGVLKANTLYPGLIIRYTTDGSTPTASSTLYEGPVEVSGMVKIAVFNTKGKAGRVSTLGTGKGA